MWSPVSVLVSRFQSCGVAEPPQHSLQHNECIGNGPRGAFSTANKLFVCQFFILYKRRGRRGNVDLFCYVLWGNWGFQCITKSLNCYFIACRWHYGRGRFSDGNQAPNCHRIFAFLHRWLAGNSAILRVDQCFQSIFAIVHFSLDATDELPNDGNTRLPWRARGPL